MRIRTGSFNNGEFFRMIRRHRIDCGTGSTRALTRKLGSRSASSMVVFARPKRLCRPILDHLRTSTLISDPRWTVAAWYLVALVFQYLAVMTAARTYGVRFVRTVLAIASQTNHREPRAGS